MMNIREVPPSSRMIIRKERAVFPIGLGAMPLSLQGRPDFAVAREVIKTYLEAGGDFVDTANVYCADDDDIGHNERLLARALADLAQGRDILVATKGGLRRPRGAWIVDGSPAWLRASCEASLRALEVERIELYQLHAVDPAVDLLHSLDELLALQAEGKIRHIGLSNVDLAQLRRAVAHAPIITVQNRCNVFQSKDLTNGMVDFCRTHDIAYIAHSPAGGHFGHVEAANNKVLQAMALKYHTTSYCVMLAWLLSKASHIVPIPGAKRVSSIADSVRAISIQLLDDDVAALDRLHKR